MATCSTLAKTPCINVGMGQVFVGQEPLSLTAVLGSCVGVVLYDKRRRIGAMGHIVLPQTNGTNAAPGKFADTAIPHMLQLLRGHACAPSNLTARIAGGSCMFGTSGPMQIGESNVQAVRALLSAAGIRITGSDVGGTRGRRVSFSPATGSVVVETIGSQPREI